MKYASQDQLRNINEVSYFIRTYASKEQIEDIFQYDERVKWWRAICHDKDTDEVGNPKIAHTHIVVEFNNRIKASTVKNLFKGLTDDKGEKINTELKQCRSKAGCYKYLTHNTEKAKGEGKYQYNEDEVFGNGEIDLANEGNEKYLKILSDMQMDTAPFEMVYKYGMLYITQIKNFKEVIKEQKNWEKQKESELKLQKMIDKGILKEYNDDIPEKR